MTWHLDPDTGDLYNPDGTVETTISGPPYSLPEDAREYALDELRNTTFATLSTDRLADLLEAVGGNTEFGVP